MGNHRRLLLEKWTELIGDVNYMENEALRKSRLDAAGDLSSMPIHMADLGTDNFEQEFSLGLMDSERKILLEIVAALRRMNDGTFGICEGTGNPISKARLNANPWARYCIDYARMVEKGVISEGEKVYRKDDTAFDDESDEIDEDFEDEDNFDDAEEEDVEFEADADDDEDEDEGEPEDETAAELEDDDDDDEGKGKGNGLGKAMKKAKDKVKDKVKDKAKDKAKGNSNNGKGR